VGLGDAEQRIAAATAEPLPAGPTAWPVLESDPDDDDSDGQSSGAGDAAAQTATSSEEA
jgi:hypothetical protein